MRSFIIPSKTVRIALSALAIGGVFVAPQISVCEEIPLALSLDGELDLDDPTGELGLREILAMALRNSEDVARLEGEISIARARELVEREFNDPELRIGWNRSTNEVLEPPYTQSETTDSSTSASRLDRDRNGVTRDTFNETERSTRIREVNPGTGLTTESETVDRSSARRGSGTNGPFSRTENSTTRSRSSIVDSRDPLDRDRDIDFALRWRPPHPWEMPKRVARAKAETSLAESEARAARRKVMLKVRELYSDLQYLRQQVGHSDTLLSAYTKRDEEQQALLADGDLLPKDIDSLASRRLRTMDNKNDATRRYRNALEDLARYAGISDPDRIRVNDRLVTPEMDLDSLTLEFLIRIAFAYRVEAARLNGKTRVSQKELEILDAQKIPWFNFVQVGYGSEETGGRRTNDNWSIGVGVSIPLFSFASKKRKVHEAEIASYYNQLGAVNRRIAQDVTRAYLGLQRLDGEKWDNTKTFDRMNHELASQIAALKLEGEPFHKQFFDKIEVGLLSTKMRMRSDQEYVRAMLRLESAIGADLSEIFTLNASGKIPMDALLPSPDARDAAVGGGYRLPLASSEPGEAEPPSVLIPETGEPAVPSISDQPGATGAAKTTGARRKSDIKPLRLKWPKIKWPKLWPGPSGSAKKRAGVPGTAGPPEAGGRLPEAGGRKAASSTPKPPRKSEPLRAEPGGKKYRPRRRP